MTDKPQPWPRYAAEARDRAAEEAQGILNDTEGAEQLTADPKLLQILNRVTRRAGIIARLLESMGAKTRPR